MKIFFTRLRARAERYRGRRLNSPNDAVVKSDRSIYFTDPPYGIKPEEQELEFQGVYRLDPDGQEPTLLVDDIERPNGLAFSPDERTLYSARATGPWQTVVSSPRSGQRSPVTPTG